jgi:hypothetical protein
MNLIVYVCNHGRVKLKDNSLLKSSNRLDGVSLDVGTSLKTYGPLNGPQHFPHA